VFGVPPPTSGLARVTIRAPRRRLDLAVPHQVPLAELLPEVLRRAGEVVPEHAGSPALAAGGWILRRGDGASLAGDAANPMLELRIGLEPDADLAEIRRRIETHAMPRLCVALALPELPARIRFHLDATRSRVRAR